MVKQKPVLSLAPQANILIKLASPDLEPQEGQFWFQNK